MTTGLKNPSSYYIEIITTFPPRPITCESASILGKQVGTTIILLLCGGDKSTQDRDIRQAIEYWTNYRS